MGVRRTHRRAQQLAASHGGTFDHVRHFCMFVGYARSGHSLVGTLLNAHPMAVIAHELDVLTLVRSGFTREQIFSLILERDRDFERIGREWTGYSYSVPHPWQGRFERLEVIGDKKGGKSAQALARQHGLLRRLRNTTKVPLRIIHVVRNPYDTITTMSTRKGRPGLKIAIGRYLRIVDSVARLRATVRRREWLDLSLETLIAHPERELTRMCGFLGLQAGDGYLDDCTKVLFASARAPRLDGPWTPELIEEVARRIAGVPFLSGYDFEHDEPRESRVGPYLLGPRSLTDSGPVGEGRDHRRPAAPVGRQGPSGAPRQYLLVANESLGSDPLIHALRRRLGAEPGAVHVLVPRVRAGQSVKAVLLVRARAVRRRLSRRGDRGAEPPPGRLRRQAKKAARRRLRRELERLEADGVPARGSVGDANVRKAIANAMAKHHVDELIVSLPPPRSSSGRATPLVDNLQGQLGVPVTVVPAPGGSVLRRAARLLVHRVAAPRAR